MLRPVTCAWLFALALQAQELRISSVAASRGKPTSVTIAFTASPKIPITALQWELVFPGATIRIQDGDWATAKKTAAASKSLACVRQLRRQPDAFAYRCILAGGNKLIPSGPVAVVMGPAERSVTVLRRRGARWRATRLPGGLGADVSVGWPGLEPSPVGCRPRR